MARTRRKTSEEPTSTASTVTEQPPTPDTSFNPDELEQETHAAKVKRQPGYTNQGISDYVAGVRIHEYQNGETKQYLSIIKFDEKPSKDVTILLRQAGFDFKRETQEWYRPVRFETRQADRVNADRVFNEVCKLVRQERGIGHDFGGAA